MPLCFRLGCYETFKHKVRYTALYDYKHLVVFKALLNGEVNLRELTFKHKPPEDKKLGFGKYKNDT